ncbi:hypothetical protein VOLCADRAFT_94026 [Volvox carteri f. nagariensis]|uniref:Uncharacterized protein n=1 Tax=Volvox carteri f. nagariensis TaxID=3068 RepID=D8U3Q1_VOLCA|nr:uncharacterized protein VOLCADRAFT_94026 [Volvox carteri f. nagariensis]EFJ45648.1 hypothetical protein VOLCADRAFT_94026 [Volvox carteri f. nagariensis]|eukprot:XP_002953338.1 hypothetical protein VOLCADRAFT_94026 [Volvox carteri f. nagariensis]
MSKKWKGGDAATRRPTHRKKAISDDLFMRVRVYAFVCDRKCSLFCQYVAVHVQCGPRALCPSIYGGSLGTGSLPYVHRNACIQVLKRNHAQVLFCEALTIKFVPCRSEFGYQVIMGSAIVAHVVEAFITLGICAKNKVSAGHTLGWFCIVMLIGYPGIHELKTRLKQAKQKQG